MPESQERKSVPVQIRMPADLNDRTQRLADREYDGKVAVLIRVALKRFIDEREDAEREAETVVAA